jgi:Mg/Co/Ni transporter MgtE
MADAGLLTLAYVATHPVDAARVLETVPPGEAAVLMTSLPARATAPVLVAMTPPRAARVLAALDDDRALELLSAAGAQGAVTVLRHVPDPRRERLLEGLSTATAVASRLLLGFPEDTVGAWADPEVIALPPSSTAAEALARVRSDPDAQGAEVYVVAADGRLKGSVALPELLRAPAISTVGALMGEPTTLPAVMPLAAALAHAGWRGASELPVVERGERLIGVLRAAKPDQALSLREQHGRRDDGGATLSGLAAAGYWHAVSGLVQLGLASLPTLGRILPEER